MGINGLMLRGRGGTQFLRPSADDVDNDWLGNNAPTSTLYKEVDEASADGDSTYIYLNIPAAGVQLCRGYFAAGTDPGVHTGHTMRVRVRTSGTMLGTLEFRLKQGASTTIGSSFATLGGAYGTTEYTLTTGEAANITDYGDLRWELEYFEEFTDSGAVRVTWIELEVPGA